MTVALGPCHVPPQAVSLESPSTSVLNSKTSAIQKPELSEEAGSCQSIGTGQAEIPVYGFLLQSADLECWLCRTSSMAHHREFSILSSVCLFCKKDEIPPKNQDEFSLL